MNDDGVIHSGHWYRAFQTIGDSVRFDEINIRPGTYDIAPSADGGVVPTRVVSSDQLDELRNTDAAQPTEGDDFEGDDPR
ncbi:MAG TPA: hypothetical protein VGL46_13345 [Pseudonocardiaceae bacterium]|jgi:hypothetical protein